jgi:hypothetical protein
MRVTSLKSVISLTEGLGLSLQGSLNQYQDHISIQDTHTGSISTPCIPVVSLYSAPLHHVSVLNFPRAPSFLQLWTPFITAFVVVKGIHHASTSAEEEHRPCNIRSCHRNRLSFCRTPGSLHYHTFIRQVLVFQLVRCKPLLTIS